MIELWNYRKQKRHTAGDCIYVLVSGLNDTWVNYFLVRVYECYLICSIMGKCP